MKLRSLKVHGFKSFADSTAVEFHDGITAVVGPNGCGKSNISDAIRWVLGEQRPTAIRGAKMEEAIFQGTVGRRPVNRGSVSLVVSNEDGALPVPFEEVELGRQVFRDGGSEYSINRSACRLRDVVDLCRDTGLGANAYAIIENRMVDAILSDRAEERRGLFEEAAGIGKYKDRRKAATRRLERAEMDLQRLEDVIGEVHTKVRSLARQKGKAQRFLEFRARRLDVEVAVVRHQLDTLRTRLSGVENELEGDVRTGEGMIAELRVAETEYETLRLRQVDAERERTERASALETVRTELARWERDLAVADERAAYAERRLALIAQERGDTRARVDSLERTEQGLTSEREEITEELGRLRAVAAERGEEVEAARARLVEARDRLEGVERRVRELARKGAQLEGDAEASDAQASELEQRLENAGQELASTAKELEELESQGDLFSGRLEDLQSSLDASAERLETGLYEVANARRAMAALRVTEQDASENATELGARRSALEALERDREGVEPVVQAVLDLGEAGVLGPLADFIEGDASAISAVEAYLGGMARALVVRDQKTVDRVLVWFSAQWEGGSGLILLPLDQAPQVADDLRGGLLDKVTARGEGAPWVRALLDQVEVPEGVGGAGPITVRNGVVRVGNPSGGTGILHRKEQLRALARDHAAALARQATAREKREEGERSLLAAEERLEALRSEWRAAEDEQRRASSELRAQSDQQGRMDRVRDELARQVEGAKAARARALERAHESRQDRAILLEQESGLGVEREEAHRGLEVVQEEWEMARAVEARVAVDLARLEGDERRLAERLQGVEEERERGHGRLGSLDEEEEGLRREQGEARTIRLEGDQATERLFADRSVAEESVREGDQALQSISEALRVAEKRVREARTAERASSDHRHGLELERQELTGRIGRIQERLEGEWGRPLETLLEDAEPVDGEPEQLQAELEELVAALESIGPVNMLAVEEHAEESERLEFLSGQRDDLVEARNDLRSAIREINKTATELFSDTFEQIREKFKATFVRLFEGGEADIWLQDPDDPLEAPIEIHASPRGKRTQRIDLLSGGERALTALSLLFGIYLVKPSPFCVLDEVDAPLDENNIGRFIRLLQDFKAETQFVVITHNPRTIEAADWIYGVTMEEPGVSTIVGVKLEDALQAAGAA